MQGAAVVIVEESASACSRGGIRVAALVPVLTGALFNGYRGAAAHRRNGAADEQRLREGTQGHREIVLEDSLQTRMPGVPDLRQQSRTGD